MSATSTLPTTWTAMAFMAAATFAMVVMHACVRHLGDALHPFEIAFFRNLFGLVFVLPLLMRRGLRQLRPKRPLLVVVRGLADACAMLLFFTALTLAPLATVTALSFTAPLFATILAIPILREVVGIRRATSVLIGFIGALIVINPSAAGLISPGAALTLGSAFFWGLALCLIKVLSRTETSIAITFWAGVVLTPVTLIAALPVWRGPDLDTIIWLLVLGGFGTIAQLCLTEAMRRAEATVVLPLDFTRLLWSAVLGYLLFAEVPGVATFVGGTLIFASVVYNAYRERRRLASPVPRAAAD